MNGSETDSARERLIHENQGMVYHLAGQTFRQLPVKHEFEDLVGYGMLGLAEAAKAFQPSKGVKFSTFAFLRIRGAIFDGISETSWMTRAQYRRHVKRQAAEQSGELDDSSTDVDFGGGNVIALEQEHIEDIAEENHSVSSSLALDETKAILIRCVEDLPRREYRLITLVYFDGMSLQDAADRVGISKSWASRVHAKIIKSLGQQILKKTGATPEEEATV